MVESVFHKLLKSLLIQVQGLLTRATDCMTGNLNDFHSIIRGTKFGKVKVADESLTTIDGKGDVNFSYSLSIPHMFCMC